ncbi:hypothetical protein TNCV_3739871 [Trichonephila clavipes]|nr:hypothetical protein TNCV_3739871 [Trichonephila clavipes]
MSGKSKQASPLVRFVKGEERWDFPDHLKIGVKTSKIVLSPAKLRQTIGARPRIRCSRRKQFFPKLYASSGTMAQTLKGSYLGKLPLWPNDPLYPCRDFRYDPEHKKKWMSQSSFSVEFTLSEKSESV